MSWLKSLFSPQAIGETARSAVKGLDSIVYTDQEMAEKTQVAQELYAKLYLAAAPSALTRRILATVMVGVWAALILFGVAVYKIDKEWSQFTFEVLREVILNPVNIIVGFYFLKQIVTEYKK